jgi:hypothetical protein
MHANTTEKVNQKKRNKGEQTGRLIEFKSKSISIRDNRISKLQIKVG